MLFDSLLKEIDKGVVGGSKFLPISLKTVAKYLNIGPRTYVLFAGASGTGKTSICMSVFILDLYDWWYKNQDKTDYSPYWIVRSMERSEVHLLAKWLCYRMYMDYGILIDVPTILGWNSAKYQLNDKLVQIIRSYDGYFRDLLKRVKIIGGPASNAEIAKQNVEYASMFGEWQDGKYIPNNPNEVVIHVTDHIGKVTGSGSDKRILDIHTDHMAQMRDQCGWMVLDIMQLNRAVEDTQRRKLFGADILPSDLQGSSKVYHNCDICLGMLNPYALQDLNHRGYDVPKFFDGSYNRFRSIKCVKNSFGADSWIKGLNFVGECGAVFELPKKDQMTPELYQAAKECKLRNVDLDALDSQSKL